MVSCLQYTLVQFKLPIIEYQMTEASKETELSAEVIAAHEKSLELARAEGAKRDVAKAAEYMRIAAEGGHPNAQTNLGYLYLAGEGVEANPSEGVRWLTAAAEQGEIQAIFNLAQVYLGGHGIPADEAKSLSLLRSAASKGHPDALYNLGLFHF